jgi:hypothetical protein
LLFFVFYAILINMYINKVQYVKVTVLAIYQYNYP